VLGRLLGFLDERVQYDYTPAHEEAVEHPSKQTLIVLILRKVYDPAMFINQPDKILGILLESTFS